MRQLFIYWVVSAADLKPACEGVLDLQQQLCRQHPGLQASLLLRDDEPRSAEATLMEIYAMAGGLDAALQQQIEALCEPATATWRRGARHVEAFLDAAH
ncbi:MAG: DUF4936 family protein [Rubrivivax sp.]